MRKRLALQCWNCPKTYFQSLEITDQQKIAVVCSYCNAEAVVDLRPYRKEIKAVMRGENNDMQNNEEIRFPDVLPTRKPE